MKNLVKNLVQKNKKCAMDVATYLAFAFCVAGFATIVADLFYQPKIAKKRDVQSRDIQPVFIKIIAKIYKGSWSF